MNIDVLVISEEGVVTPGRADVNLIALNDEVCLEDFDEPGVYFIESPLVRERARATMVPNAFVAQRYGVDGLRGPVWVVRIDALGHLANVGLSASDLDRLAPENAKSNARVLVARRPPAVPERDAVPRSEGGSGEDGESGESGEDSEGEGAAYEDEDEDDDYSDADDGYYGAYSDDEDEYPSPDESDTPDDAADERTVLAELTICELCGQRPALRTRRVAFAADRKAPRGDARPACIGCIERLIFRHDANWSDMASRCVLLAAEPGDGGARWTGVDPHSLACWARTRTGVVAACVSLERSSAERALAAREEAIAWARRERTACRHARVQPCRARGLCFHRVGFKDWQRVFIDALHALTADATLVLLQHASAEERARDCEERMKLASRALSERAYAAIADCGAAPEMLAVMSENMRTLANRLVQIAAAARRAREQEAARRAPSAT